MIVRLLLIVIVLGLMGGAPYPAHTASRSFDAQLRRLIPERPAGYLSLAEELMVSDQDGGDSQVAELLTRAVFYGYQRGELKTASSACIALAQISNAEMSDWLWDLAYLIDPSRSAEWAMTTMQRPMSGTENLDVAAAQCLYAVRYHEYPESAELFGRREVRARILERAADVGIEERDAIRVIEQEIQRGEDDPCRGRLYIIDRDTGERVTCPDHLRALGLSGNDDDLRLLLRIEMALLSIRVDRWDAAMAMSLDQPIQTPSVRDLVQRMRVDPRDAYYRGGSWQSTP